MNDAAPVVWLDGGEARDDAVRALAEWARARGVRIATPEDASATPTSDGSAADRAEAELERARSSIAAADADGAERALARAETLLREHPELPQAAWLRAEVHRAWSARWLRLEPRDDERARGAWQDADALDGGRVAGVGETSFPPLARSTVTFVVDGSTPGVELRVDGRGAKADAARTGTFTSEVAPGEHQVVVALGGHVGFASWVTTGAASAPIHVSADDGGACSRDRLGGVHLKDGAVEAAGVACPTWVAASVGQRRGSILVARCSRSACGPLLEWRLDLLPEAERANGEHRNAAWPTWATWTLVGVGAATALSIGLVASGVFESRPVEQRFVVGGARQE